MISSQSSLWERLWASAESADTVAFGMPRVTSLEMPCDPVLAHDVSFLHAASTHLRIRLSKTLRAHSIGPSFAARDRRPASGRVVEEHGSGGTTCTRANSR